MERGEQQFAPKYLVIVGAFLLACWVIFYSPYITRNFEPVKRKRKGVKK